MSFLTTWNTNGTIQCFLRSRFFSKYDVGHLTDFDLPIRFPFALLLVLIGGIFSPALSQSLKPAAADSSANIAGKAKSDTSLLSQVTPSPTSNDIDRRAEPGIFDFITNLPMDWRDWAVNSFQLQYWPQYTAIAVSTAAMIVYDNQMWKPFEKEYNKNSTFQTASDLFVDVGDGRFQFGLAGGYLVYGVIAGDARALRTASQVCEVILASGGVVQLLKHVTGRESPIDITYNPTGRWDWFPNQIDYLYHTSHYDAFPSGHLTTALATLTVIGNNYPEQKWINPVGYAVCAGLSVGLVAQSVHWWSDFPLAIALGIGFGDVVSPNPNGDVSVPQPTKKNMGMIESTVHTLMAQTTIVPTMEPGGGGLSMIVKF